MPSAWDYPIMAQRVTIAKHDKRKRLVLPDDFVAEAPYGEYIIHEGKGLLSIVATPHPRTKRSYKAPPAWDGLGTALGRLWDGSNSQNFPVKQPLGRVGRV